MRKIIRFLFCSFLLITIFSSSILFEPASSAGSTPAGILPVVAIHVSEYTEAQWSNPAWEYMAIYRMVEEAFKADGTPFVEISDANIIAGGLLASGSPKYPILFSLAAECISDEEANQINSYVNAGGFVYVGASSWTKYPDGSPRTNFALTSQMGLTCSNLPPNNWNEAQNVTRTTDHRLVNHIPKNVQINWQLPITDHTVCSLEKPIDLHYSWGVTGAGAQSLLTIDGKIMLALKQVSNGAYIYHSELAPLASYSIFSPVAYEYVIFRQAVEWAFELLGIPFARLSAWPYQYNSAFVVRHDLDISYERVPWIASSAAVERALGVTGQYYVVTGDVREASNSAELISFLQQAQALGAQIGSHNGGLNCTPWDPSQTYGDYLFYHWGPDEAMEKYPTGFSDGLNYANNSIRMSLDDLQSWLGVRPQIWVSPSGHGCWEESYQVLDSLGIRTSGEFAPAPYPGFAFSLTKKTETYDAYVVPFSRWITSSGYVCQSIEGIIENAPLDMQKLVDFYYNLGALVSPYGHESSESGLTLEFLQRALSKPYMWNATPTHLREWGLMRQQIHTTQEYSADGVTNLTITLTGSTSPNTAIDVKLPLSIDRVADLQILLNGAPTSNFREYNGGLKIQAGLASKVTIIYSVDNTRRWVQTSQEDFKAGTLTNLNAESVPGQLSLSRTTLFSDDFSSASYTSSHWNVVSGSWTVSGGYYILNGQQDQLAFTATSESPAWTDYAVETKVQYISGPYTGELCARVNPTTGSRYTFLTYPNWDGPNGAKLVKFSSWQDTSGTILSQGSVPTDNEWHIIRMELSGSNIKCYYDGTLVFNVVDSSYTSGRVGFESYGPNTALFDWINVTTLTYSSKGNILSSTHDSGSENPSWKTICWSASLPAGTSILLRTRTASTESGLASAAWSNNYTVSGSTIISPSNRWIQYQAILETSNQLVSPTIFDVTVIYLLNGTQGQIVYTLNIDMTATVIGSHATEISEIPREQNNSSGSLPESDTQNTFGNSNNSPDTENWNDPAQTGPPDVANSQTAKTCPTAVGLENTTAALLGLRNQKIKPPENHRT